MASLNVIVVLPLAMLAWARLVKSHSFQPKGLFNVNVERVISLVEQEGAVAQTTMDSVNPLHG